MAPTQQCSCIPGATLTVSGVDILDGTPIIDIKPYIPQYDSPDIKCHANTEVSMGPIETIPAADKTGAQDITDRTGSLLEQPVKQLRKQCLQEISGEKYLDINNCGEGIETKTDELQRLDGTQERLEKGLESNERDFDKNLPECVVNENAVSQSDAAEKDNFVTAFVKETDDNRATVQSEVSTLAADVTSASWIQNAPVTKLKVRFTSHAEEQLDLFTKNGAQSTPNACQLKFVKTAKEAKDAIINILQQDPRSIYRRKQCHDSLYYLTFDMLHVTCWFDDDMAEIVRIKSVTEVQKLKGKINI